MKATVQRDKFLAALTAANRVCTKGTLGTLGGVRLSVVGSKLEIVGTDLETTMAAYVLADASDGSCLVDGAALAKQLKDVKAEDVSLVAEDGELAVTVGSVKLRAKLLDESEYPQLTLDQGIDPTCVVQMSGRTFKETLSRLIVSASKDESRQLLTTINIQVKEGTITLASTDSYRLSVEELDTQGMHIEGEVESFCLPGAYVRKLLQVIKAKANTPDRVTLFFDDRQVAVLLNNHLHFVRGVEGQYPNYRQLLPQGYDNTVWFDATDMLSALAPMRALSKDTKSNLPVKLLAKDGEIEVSFNVPDHGELITTIPAATGETDPAVIAFNPEFLADACTSIQSLDGEGVVMEFADGLRPVLFTPAWDGFKYLLMPVRLS